MAERRVDSVLPLLRIPPFPGSRPRPFAVPVSGERSRAQIDQLIEAIRLSRVGGVYWGRQPDLPAKPFALVSVRDAIERERIIAAIDSEKAVICVGNERVKGKGRIEWVRDCDPWHLIESADEIFADADDEVSLIGTIAGNRVRLAGEVASIAKEESTDRREWARNHAALNYQYLNPFTGEPIALLEAVLMCSFWRKLIDSNRPIVAAIGFAAWKRPTVAPLLWAGSRHVNFAATAAKVSSGDQVAIWKSRLAPRTLSALYRRQAHLVEVEDGFIRSVGLGAECIPPLSIVVDHLGAYFDPSEASELELLIEEGGFSAPLLERARSLHALIVERGISKYGSGSTTIERRSIEQRHLLVVGQVEDDRSVLSGGGPVSSNLELLRRVREIAPDAFITYKPHPDVEAGHRVGAISRKTVLKLANEIVDDQLIGALIDQVDEVHVNTSLAGFEALMRNREVVVHGVPFYAGWGLTRDLGAVPSRRTARRTVDELVAAVLLMYPRYLDPETGLPCPPEVLIRRLTAAARPARGTMLVRLRRMQGRLRRGLHSLRERRPA